MRTDSTARMRPIGWLHLGFALTGIATTLLGCLLPTLGAIWHMNDNRAGILFAAQFSGASLGALLVGSNFYSSVVRGYLLLITSAVSIPFTAGSFAWLPFFSFGLGLGLAMTATSMLIGSIFADRRGAALSLLNASWAIGAGLSPAIVSLWTSRWPPIELYLALAIFGSIILLTLTQSREAFSSSNARKNEINSDVGHIKSVLIFAVIAFLYIGVEVSVGGWMMLYVHRILLSSNIWAPIATFFFWIALLCGRIIAPALLHWVSEAELFTGTLLIAFTSVVSLLLSHTPALLIFSAAFAGLAFAPIYPLCLAKVLALANDSPKIKWIFATSGLGGAILPWMTGKLSVLNSSLRGGLMVPVFALGVMLILYCIELTRGARGENTDTVGEGRRRYADG
ncbi:MAG: transporter, major facilitator family [Acidobacteriaceae bacterium]|nr:transporter, major facilitator family [Acidobacteriaceae bacterium]